ncbi:MAG: hypothetical protein ACI8RD_008974, partial [Bacillariaceae sp.]
RAPSFRASRIKHVRFHFKLPRHTSKSKIA